MRPMLRLALILLTLTAGAAAQVVYSTPAFAPGSVNSAYLPTAAYPTGQSNPNALPALPFASLLPGIAGAVSGGMASDDRKGRLYTSDGSSIAVDRNPTFAGFGALTLPGGPNPAPVALPTPLLITGLAFDDAGGRLWACDGISFYPLSVAPPYVAVGPVLPIPGLLGGAFATGLGFDAATGTLWACDGGGCVYHFTTAGAPVGLQPVACVPTIAPAGGLAVNDSNGVGSWPVPACSTQVAGFHVTISDGLQIYDALGGNPPIPYGATANGSILGLTYSSDHQTKSCSDTGCSLWPVRAGTPHPSWVGGAATQELKLIGGPPSTIVTLIADLCPQPACWFGLWFNPFTWTLGYATTDAFGEATIPLGFAIPAGVQFSFQYAIPDTLAPLGYCFTNSVTVTSGLP